MPIIDHDIRKINKYFITPDYLHINSKEYFYRIEKILDYGIKLVQFRSKNLSILDYAYISKKLYILCKKYNALYIINDKKNFDENTYCDGIQLTSENLIFELNTLIYKNYLLIGSCHNALEVQICNRINTNFILISPIKNTKSKKGIGWKEFKRLCKFSKNPVFALGGLNFENDLPTAIMNGAVGVAASSYIYNLIKST